MSVRCMCPPARSVHTTGSRLAAILKMRGEGPSHVSHSRWQPPLTAGLPEVKGMALNNALSLSSSVPKPWLPLATSTPARPHLLVGPHQPLPPTLWHLSSEILLPVAKRGNQPLAHPQPYSPPCKLPENELFHFSAPLPGRHQGSKVLHPSLQVYLEEF